MGQSSIDASIANLKSLGFTNGYIAKSLKAGISDCQRFIDKEAGRDASLRPAKVQQHLDFCIAHKAALQAAIAKAQGGV